ncbi:MAG: site-specific integrase [Myxococcaceae bacterium]|nr:MAG: site-specific integrase [Myxococcaceae bacterium]
MARPIKHGQKWRIRWIDEKGERRSAVYDTRPLAMRAQRAREHEVDEVKQGLRAPAPPDMKFTDLEDYWIKHRVPQKRSGQNDISIIKKHLHPAFRNRRLRDLGVHAVDALVATLATKHRKTVANVLTLLISMLNAAVELGWLLKAPRIRKPKVKTADADFRYLRTKEQLALFLGAARSEGDHIHALYATAIHTGLRAGELAALRWDDVDFSRRIITVSKSFDGPTKSGVVRHVPLVDALLPTLAAWKLRGPGVRLFTSERGTMLGKSARPFQEVLHRVLKGAGIAEVERNGKMVRAITFHGLRHTFASHWVMAGGDIFKLQRILGHQSVAMTMRYAHLAPDAFAGDLARFGPAQGTGPGVVIELPRRTG